MKSLNLLASTLFDRRRSQLGPRGYRGVRPGRDARRARVRRDECDQPRDLWPRRSRSGLRDRHARRRSRPLRGGSPHVDLRLGVPDERKEADDSHHQRTARRSRARSRSRSGRRGRPGQRNLVQTAAASGQFDRLATLLSKAGLAKTLQQKGPYTVFAPTDAALREGTEGDRRRVAREQGEAPGGSAVPRRRGKGHCGSGDPAVLRRDGERQERSDPRVRLERIREPLEGHEARCDGVERRDPRDQPGPDPAAVAMPDGALVRARASAPSRGSWMTGRRRVRRRSRRFFPTTSRRCTARARHAFCRHLPSRQHIAQHAFVESDKKFWKRAADF